MQVENAVSAWRQGVERGAHWLADQITRKPCFGTSDSDLNWCAKLPWTFAACGDRIRTAHILEHVTSRYIDRDRVISPSNVEWTNATPYALGWLVCGAVTSESYGVAHMIYRHLQEYVCGQTGGLFSTTHSPSEKYAYFDASIQGAGLHAAIYIGDLDAAKRAGDLLIHYIDKQPNLNNGIYTRFHPKLGYVTNTNDRCGRKLFARGVTRQPFANLGFILQGLSRLGGITRKSEYVDAACRLLDMLIDLGHDDLCTHSQNHKVAHAALLLHCQTGREDYKTLALQIATLIDRNLLPDGRAWADVTEDGIKNQSHFATVRTTCDSVIWLKQICDLLET